MLYIELRVFFWSGYHERGRKSVLCFEDCSNVISIPDTFTLTRNARHMKYKQRATWLQSTHTYFTVYSTHFPISLNVSGIDVTLEPSSNLFRTSLQISKPKISTQTVQYILCTALSAAVAETRVSSTFLPPARLLT